MLFAPRRCFVCRRILRRDEEILCTACLSDIQQTGIFGEPDNVVERLFWGVTPVERAASWLKYTSGSNVGEMIHALKYAGMIRIGHLLGLADIPLRKRGLYLCLIVRNVHPVHQVVLHQTVPHRLQAEDHTSGSDRRQQCVRIVCQKHDDRIGRRLFYRLQKSVLSLERQLVGIIYNIDLVRAFIRLDTYVVNQLIPDLVDSNRIRLLMGDVYDIGMVLIQSFLTGCTFHARLDSVFLALQRHSKQRSQQLLA